MDSNINSCMNICIYTSVGLEYKKKSCIQTRTCWYCDTKCDTFISICNSCKIERNKNKSSFQIKSL